jgi:hypothetical protein
MADLAVVFHWAPRDMADMSLTELMEWRERARARVEPDDDETTHTWTPPPAGPAPGHRQASAPLRNIGRSGKTSKELRDTSTTCES